MSKAEFDNYGVSIKINPRGGKKYINGVVNFPSMVDNCKDGLYNNEHEIKKQFTYLKKAFHAYERECIRVFHESSNCKHEVFDKSTYSLRKNILDYYYHFEKKCSNCGKSFTTTMSAEDFSEYEGNFPEGYEGAEKQFYNLDI